MTQYFLKRFLSLSITLFVATIIIFLMIEVVPGDPAAFMMGLSTNTDAADALRAELGLNMGAWDRYWGWLGGMMSGDFGTSYTYRVPVSELITERLMVSLPLTLYALTLSTIIAIPIGVISASNHGKPLDTALMGTAQFGVAVPNFWFAILLVLLFSTVLNWFSAGGFPGWDAGFLTAMGALTLPAISLALPQAAILSRVMRSSVLEVMNEDYIRTARAKGLSKKQALMRHGLRNAMIPVLTILGLQFSFLLAGGIIIESIFSLPGLGRLVFQAISQRDLIVVKSIVTLLVFAVVMITFLVDVAYAWVDPRLRDGGRR
ncbi:ABC transporter permease [Pseudemcibacter aquimaris]|uniref:ABC transporter permease n=1 Tax=Pseudemcibacter aquimaris TaxID=2857064 RepID=UPI0020133DE3|nr:ABC transporter permease [Pseudemcibacter aquimaris]MCC3859711.1 ABC transporter permease [Pseudemcibacter aquimaris]WDU60106.1 ABC transporter permease [Pseudemcibacter aquimaris]